MLKTDLIAQHFIDRGIKLEGSVVEDHDRGGYLVFVTVETDKTGKQVPSNYAISKVEKAAEKELGIIRVILLRRGDEDISASIKSMIMKQYADDVRNVFSSVNRGEVSVWVEPKSATNKQKSNEIRASIAGMLEYFGLGLNEFINTSELNLPSDTVCLNTIRLKSPVSLDDIVSELGRRGFEVPGQDWLLRRLDRWRRNQLIHRKQDDLYVMTVKGLTILGSGKNRRSPDVVRALELASWKH